MSLPDTFQFSQSKLQDYVECPRRFQLRYVLMQPWPALITGDPVKFEQHRQRAADFHRLAQQRALGLDPEHLAATIHDETLARWWQTFLAHPPAGLPEAVRRAEVVVAASLQSTTPAVADRRLVAKFDMLAIEPGELLVIVDWKTSLKRPRRATLAERLQTRVYRYLAVEAGAALNGGQRPEPEQVEMLYWFASKDGATEHFPYDAKQYDADRVYLADLVTEISACEESIWPLTPDVRHCRFCNYRSLCERDVKPGFLTDLDEDLEPAELEIDLEQVAEIEF
ncbi:MAG: PD-(D/E)XK nuclease family protein [Anaerolineae bacterium]|jgi:CRISPR/Cas system-associated exonuclease Cas4 (RecB family)